MGEIAKLEESDITEQTLQTLEKIDKLLAEAGTNKSRYILFFITFNLLLIKYFQSGLRIRLGFARIRPWREKKNESDPQKRLGF